MTEFEKTEWVNDNSAKEFIKNSDLYIQDRKRLLTILKSFYGYYLGSVSKPVRVMDLGCGDGRITEELLKVDNNLNALLIDGSEEMLKNAKNRLRFSSDIDYMQLTFQELIDDNNLNVNFDFVVSSLAIHHLSLRGKELLFKFVYDHLHDGGFFVNIDVVQANSVALEEWYLTLWEEWIREKESKNGISTGFTHIPQKYKNNPDNHPDKLSDQLNVLKSIGFRNVDCYYKYGIFSIYGGQK